MHFEVLLNNNRRVLPAVWAFAREALRQISLAPPQIDTLVELVERSVRATIERAYPVGEDGSIRLRITESQGKLAVTVRDYGMPQDVQTLERQLHEPDCPNLRLFGIACKGIADEIHWLGCGPEGKALQIIKWLHNTYITAQAPEDTLEAFREGALLPRRHHFGIGKSRSDREIVGRTERCAETHTSRTFEQDPVRTRL